MKTMKSIWSYTMLFMMTVCSLSLASCSDDDDDDNNNSTPAAYETYAAKYQMTSNQSPYSSVEFTESGNYIIILNNAPATNAKLMSPSVTSTIRKAALTNGFAGKLLRKAATRSQVYSPILYGTYTVDADGTYILDGYGKVKVVQDGSGNSVSLEFTPESGETFTYTASKMNRDLNSNNTNRLCRTWDLASVQYIIRYNGQELVNLSAENMPKLYEKLMKWAEDNDEEYDPSDWESEEIIDVKQVIFTKTGTYMVKYSNDELAISTWRWIDSNENKLQYSWDNDFDNDYNDGYVNINYKGSQLVIDETTKDEEESFEESFFYYFNEAK